jgi:hypothetical protein
MFPFMNMKEQRKTIGKFNQPKWMRTKLKFMD